jgi:hypothetical protein
MEKISQEDYFGKTQKAFNVETLKNIIQEDKIMKNPTFANTKKYFLTYFAKSLDGIVYEYQPQEDDDEGLIYNRLSRDMTNIFENFTPTEYFGVDGQTRKFILQDWFKKEQNETFKINSDPRTKRFYTATKTGQKYINLSKGFLHKTYRKFETFPEKTKQNVLNLINHIKNVWNSGDENCTEYTLNWMAHAFTGHKMNAALFLKSGEGTGKSIIIEFIIQHVIGPSLGLITSKSQQIMKFNSQLLGKIFLNLEELPTGNKNDWHCLADILKDLITGKYIDIEQKFKDCIQTLNLISLIIMTNNDNTIKFGKDIRRYMMCDVSHDLVGNDDYFKKLAQSLNKETGEAFFMWLTERYEATKDFKESEMPITDAKKEMKQRHLGPVLEYIKSNYVATKKDLSDLSKKHSMILLSDMKDLVNFDHNKKYSTQAFHIQLKSDIPIIKTIVYGKNKQMYIEPLSYKELLAFYTKKGFWSEKFDTYTDDEDLTELNNDLDENTIKPVQSDDKKYAKLEQNYNKIIDVNAQLLEQNNKLMEQINMLLKLQSQQQEVKPETKQQVKVNIVEEVEEDILDDDDEFDNFFNQSQTHIRKFGK